MSDPLFIMLVCAFVAGALVGVLVFGFLLNRVSASHRTN